MILEHVLWFKQLDEYMFTNYYKLLSIQDVQVLIHCQTNAADDREFIHLKK